MYQNVFTIDYFYTKKYLCLVPDKFFFR